MLKTNVREYGRNNTIRQSRETGNIGMSHSSEQFRNPIEKSKQNRTDNFMTWYRNFSKMWRGEISKDTTQYVLHITIRKQTQITYKQLEVTTTQHRLYAEIVTDITTRNKKHKDT
jgi:hypothetical protein